jgi:NAD(P)-dependent dehydrogenase (short-subunit alcohol dehydrogenase family)
MKESFMNEDRKPTPPYSKQKLEKPGLENEMEQKPKWRSPNYRPAQKLENKVAIVTGGDSGIGRAVAYLFACEGADVAISYLPEEEKDAQEVKNAIEETGRRCLCIPGDLTDAKFCREVIEKTVREFGQLDILVSNAAYQNRKKDIADITEEEWHHTFQTNMDAYFFLTQAALKHMKSGSSIIATSSETAIVGSENLLDYSSTKGAIIAFTKSLANKLATKGIRVNSVAPGPVWTPLNPADEGQDPDEMKNFGESQPMKRAAQPEEIAPAYVFLASEADSSYISGIVLEEMGGLTAAA